MSTKRLTTVEFVEKARKIHGDLYDYRYVEYVRSHSKVHIIDPDHGSFWITPNAHLCGQGNPIRGREACDAKRRIGLNRFVERARAQHGDLYDYSQVSYINVDTKVTIIDPDYGPFEQTPYQHANIGSGHPMRPNRRSETDFDHIIPLSIVMCSKDRRLRDEFQKNRPLVLLLQSDANIRSVSPKANKSKHDYVEINGKLLRASSLRNNYDVISYLIRQHLGIDPLGIIEEDRSYIKTALNLFGPVA
jgi:hypothetical protein